MDDLKCIAKFDLFVGFKLNCLIVLREKESENKAGELLRYEKDDEFFLLDGMCFTMIDWC